MSICEILVLRMSREFLHLQRNMGHHVKEGIRITRLDRFHELHVFRYRGKSPCFEERVLLTVQILNTVRFQESVYLVFNEPMSFKLALIA